MVWWCINSRGTGFVWKVEGMLNGEGYINILENAMIPTTKYIINEKSVELPM